MNILPRDDFVMLVLYTLHRRLVEHSPIFSDWTCYSDWLISQSRPPNLFPTHTSTTHFTTTFLIRLVSHMNSLIYIELVMRRRKISRTKLLRVVASFPASIAHPAHPGFFAFLNADRAAYLERLRLLQQLPAFMPFITLGPLPFAAHPSPSAPIPTEQWPENNIQ